MLLNIRLECTAKPLRKTRVPALSASVFRRIPCSRIIRCSATEAKTSASTTKVPLPYNIPEAENQVQEAICTSSLVFVDNSSSPTLTRLTIDVPDFPGLLRTVTWVLNGMGLRVQYASLSTKDATASDTFWLTTWNGKKLTEDQALLMKERVQDFVVACQPSRTQPTEWLCHNVAVSNTEHPQWTVLTVRGEPRRQGFLLELASVISGTGACVQEAYIQAAPVEPAAKEGSRQAPAPVAVAPPDYDYSEGRFFKFLLSDEKGAKLDASRIGALLFTYDVHVGRHHMPLVAPNVDTYLQQQGCNCP